MYSVSHRPQEQGRTRDFLTESGGGGGVKELKFGSSPCTQYSVGDWGREEGRRRGGVGVEEVTGVRSPDVESALRKEVSSGKERNTGGLNP